MISCSETVGKLTYVTLTETGSNHRKLNIPNQDSVIIDVIQDDFVVAVSDGVGSCKKSEIGSQMVTAVCKDLFHEIHKGYVSFEGKEIVKLLIERWKNSLEGNLMDYCATVKGVFKIGKKAVMISLGDGFAVITSEGMRMVSPNDDSAFSNETKCLDSKVCVGDFWIRNFDIDINTMFVVFVCTDGVANAIQAGSEMNFVEEIEKNIESNNLEEELKDFMIDISQYSFDDKTLGVMKYER